MPIDSRDKRASALLVGLPSARVLPNRDGAVTPVDFEHVALSYRGIQAGMPAVPILPPDSFVMLPLERPPFIAFPVGQRMLDLAQNGRPPTVDGRYLDESLNPRPPYAPGQG